MSYRVATNATSRNSEPTTQWRVQKQTPENMNINAVAIEVDCSSNHHCIVNCLDNVK